MQFWIMLKRIVIIQMLICGDKKMTVKELIKMLEKHNENAEVWYSGIETEQPIDRLIYDDNRIFLFPG